MVGDEAAPILTGTKAVPGWSGELLHVPDADAAVDALQNRLAPGDVVLVKALAPVGLERVALALTGERRRFREAGLREGPWFRGGLRSENHPPGGRGVAAACAVRHAAGHQVCCAGAATAS